MKREILRYEENEDGTYTKVEKTTVTPEDGWIEHEPYIASPGKRRYFKGYGTSTTYYTNDPKIVRPALILSCIGFVLLLAGVFAFFMLVVKDPEQRKTVQVFFAGAGVFTALIFMFMFIQVRKQKRAEQEDDIGQAERPQGIEKDPPSDM